MSEWVLWLVAALPLGMAVSLSELFGSQGEKYYRAANFPDGWSERRTIKDFEVVEFEDTGDKKMAIVFEEDDTPMLILNVTLKKWLVKQFSNDAESAIGTVVEMFRTETQFRNDTVPCIRLRMPKAKPKRGRKIVEVDEEDLDVPF